MSLVTLDWVCRIYMIFIPLVKMIGGVDWETFA